MGASTRDVLVKARELIKTPDRWTRKAFARGRTGRRVEETGKAAVCWCALGAINKSHFLLGYEGLDPAQFLYDALDLTFGLADWNDAPERTHAEVLAAFDRAIEAVSPAIPASSQEAGG